MTLYAKPWNRTPHWGSRRDLRDASRQKAGIFGGSLTRLSGPWTLDEQANSSADIASEDALDGQDDADPADDRLARARVEAILLISKSPISNRKLATLARLQDATQARTLIGELNDLYQRQGRGLRIEQIAGGSRMMTRPVVAPWLRRLGFLPPAIRLSLPMMETLAFVAYRQDVTRADVEAVRGVACGEILRQLMQIDLVRISGRSEDLGRPYLYGTTKRFLEICGLASIDALPPIDWHTASQDDNQPSPIEPPSGDPVGDPDDKVTVTKESDVSLALTDALAATAATLPLGTANSDEGTLNSTATTGLLDADEPSTAAQSDPSGNAADPQSVIEDEEDDLYEKGFEDDDDEDFVDDEDDWDDEDDDESDAESDDDDVEADEDSDDEAEDGWEEVDDDEADEDWEDDETDDEEEDWDDDEDSEDDDWEEED